VVVFHPLRREQLEEVLDIELGQCSSACWKRQRAVFFRVTMAGRDFLLKEGTDQRYGARPPERALSGTSYIRWPTCLRPSKCIWATWLHRWDREHSQLTFIREGEGALGQNHLGQRASCHRRRSERRSQGRDTGRSHHRRKEAADCTGSSGTCTAPQALESRSAEKFTPFQSSGRQSNHSAAPFRRRPRHKLFQLSHFLQQ